MTSASFCVGNGISSWRIEPSSASTAVNIVVLAGKRRFCLQNGRSLWRWSHNWGRLLEHVVGLGGVRRPSGLDSGLHAAPLGPTKASRGALKSCVLLPHSPHCARPIKTMVSWLHKNTRLSGPFSLERKDPSNPAGFPGHIRSSSKDVCMLQKPR